ncbi:MAG: Ig-like domain-containing protein [Dysgonamonadaceae bacterium]|nr:Ig-like domain-containing protein [Dysgonamonadaceae bacterium]
MFFLGVALILVLTAAEWISCGDNAPKVIEVSAIELNKTSISLKKGDRQTLTATVLPDNATAPSVTWASSNATIASVNSGVVTAINEGTVSITATAGKESASCTVTVIPATAPITPTVWKVLWLICPTVSADIRGTHYNTQMTTDQIEMVKQKAAWYEEFLENAADGYLDVQLTIDVLKNPVTDFDYSDNDTWGAHIPLADRIRLKPEENFDCQIITVDYTGIPKVNWLGITTGRTSWIMFCSNGCAMTYGGLNPDASTKRFHTNVYVHEWCHQIEGYFPSISSSFSMPTLHNDQSEYAYTDQNTGLSGEERLSKWYYDYIHGSVVSYPGATGKSKGVQPSWWQYPPLMWKNKVKVSPENYAVNVTNPLVLTVEWEKSVKSTWTDDFHIVIKDGITDVETGFYRVTSDMSNGNKKLTVDFSKPVYRMWDWVDETVQFQPGHPYRIYSYSFDYVSKGTGVNGENASFDILFTMKP